MAQPQGYEKSHQERENLCGTSCWRNWKGHEPSMQSPGSATYIFSSRTRAETAEGSTRKRCPLDSEHFIFGSFLVKFVALKPMFLIRSHLSSSSMEVVRRPRGRPSGSKNKPKPPVFLTPEPPMSPYILQVPSGNDVVEAINRFCRRKSIGFCVLSGSGSVANVTLRQPSPAAPGSTITFHGNFDLLSVSATFLPPPPRTSLSPPVSNFFTVSLAGPQGQIIGGFVAGPLVSAGTVYVIAAGFNNPSYHRLPAEENQQKTETREGEEGQSPPVSGGAMYSCHMGPHRQGSTVILTDPSF